MKTATESNRVNRRVALAGLGASGLGLALLAQPNGAAADHMSREERAWTAASGTVHAAVGMWLLIHPTSPPTPTMVMLTTDGLAISCGTVSRAEGGPHPLAAYSDGAKNAAAASAAPASVVFSSPSMGTWESTSDRSIHLALTTIDTNADGAVTGTLTGDTYPVVHVDRMSFADDGLRTRATARDASGAVISVKGGAVGQVPIALPLTALRMGGGQSGFAEAGPIDHPTPTAPAGKSRTGPIA